MPVIEESITIDRPVSEVFAYMSDVTNVTVYDASVVLSTQEGPGETQVGTRWRGVTRILGRDFGWVGECVELERDRFVMIRAIEGRLQFETRMVVTPEGGGTRLDYRVSTASGLGGIFGDLDEAFVTEVQTRTVKANLVTVKALLEGAAATGLR